MNHEILVEYIKNNFVPASGAVEELQTGRYGGRPTAASRWFEPVARRALDTFAPDFWKKFKTYQGMYVVDPGGTVYIYKLGLPYDPAEFKQELASALKKWKAANPAARRMARTKQALSTHRKAVKPAISIVEVYSRILPLPQNATLSEKSIGRDLMWIYPEDCQAILRTASRVGQTVKMPTTLVARMVRFQLLNHVGNVMQAFEDKDVRKADFTVRRLADRGNLRRFHFAGSYESFAPARQKHLPQSLQGTISGEFSIDPNVRKIVRFRAYGEGNSRGGNDSLDEKRNYPVVFAMREAQHQYARSIVPIWAAIPSIAGVYEKPSLKIR